MTSEQCSQTIIAEDAVDFFAQYNGDINQLIRTTGSDCYQIIDDRFAVVYFSSSETVKQLDETNYSSIPKLYGLMDLASAEASGISRVRRQSELGLLGSGTMIGFVDTGIDYTHPAFRNADGTTRIAYIWDQSSEEGQNPPGFGYGSEYSAEMLNQALISENPLETVDTTDVEGHGTFLAGVAAGNENLNEEFTGFAPLAEIVMVKLKPAKKYLKEFFCIREETLCYQENDIALGIRYLMETAIREGKPMAICIGLGCNQQSHDGSGIIDQMLDSLSQRVGFCAVTPCGNEGNASAHYRGGLFSRAATENSLQGLVVRELPGSLEEEELLRDITGYEDMQIRVAENEAGFTLSLWGKVPGRFSVAILSPSGEYSGRLPQRVDFSTTLNFIFENTTVYVSYEIIEQRSGDQLVLLRFQRPAQGIWTVRVFFEGEFSTVFDAWLPVRTFIQSGTYFLSPDPDITISDPGNNRLAMTAAGYDYRTGGIFIESGRGYTRDLRIKPDFAAPAVNIRGPVPGTGYALRSGTSIAAAQTAGACALIMEYAIVRKRRLFLNGIELKQLMIQGAASGGTSYPDREFGWGRINVYEAIASLRG